MQAPYGNPFRQAGITMPGAIVLGALLAFWVLIAIKLLPVYMDARAVREVFKQYEQEHASVGTDKKKVHGYFSRFFQINAIYDVDPKQVAVEKRKKDVRISLDYEVRVPFITDSTYGDLMVLMVFSEEVVVPRSSDE